MSPDHPMKTKRSLLSQSSIKAMLPHQKDDPARYRVEEASWSGLVLAKTCLACANKNKPLGQQAESCQLHHWNGHKVSCEAQNMGPSKHSCVQTVYLQSRPLLVWGRWGIWISSNTLYCFIIGLKVKPKLVFKMHFLRSRPGLTSSRGHIDPG